jgi:hypothetical protein
MGIKLLSTSSIYIPSNLATAANIVKSCKVRAFHDHLAAGWCSTTSVRGVETTSSLSVGLEASRSRQSNGNCFGVRTDGSVQLEPFKGELPRGSSCVCWLWQSIIRCFVNN